MADTLPLLPRERVTITDYKSSDVRDPAKARQRARESLQLTIYAMGYQAHDRPAAGCGPAAASSNPGSSAGPRSTSSRLAKARAQIADAAAGIRARDFTPKPDPLACSYCPFRDICPASATRLMTEDRRRPGTMGRP